MEAKQLEEGKSENKFRTQREKSLVETTTNVMDHIKSMGGK